VQPAGHRAAAHLDLAGVRSRDKLGCVCRVHADHQASPATRGNGHVAVDQECQPAEHALVGDSDPAREQSAQALSELFVVGHVGRVSSPSRAAFLRRHPRSEVRGGVLEPVVPPEHLVVDRDRRHAGDATLERVL
jgi:hypothetical protein